jgi:hypothetical protein
MYTSAFDLLRSFPDALQAAAFDVVALVADNSPVEAIGLQALQVGSETLHYPGRIYLARRELEDAVHEWPCVRRQIALCLGLRHHDGFFRESCLRRLGALDADWKMAFALPLLGDYVLEISSLAAQLLLAAPRTEALAFVAANAAAALTARRRAISYWDCYDRDRIAAYTQLPSVQCLDKLLPAGGLKA